MLVAIRSRMNQAKRQEQFADGVLRRCVTMRCHQTLQQSPAFRSLSAMFGLAERWGYIESNPCRRMQAPTVPKREPTVPAPGVMEHAIRIATPEFAALLRSPSARGVGAGRSPVPAGAISTPSWVSSPFGVRSTRLRATDYRRKPRRPAPRSSASTR